MVEFFPGNSIFSTMESVPHLLKLLILGDFRVGKTHLIRGITLQPQVLDYQPTFAVVFSKTDFHTETKAYRLLLWEVGGYPSFTDIAKAYVNSADAVLVLFSEDKPGSWESRGTWLDLIPPDRLSLQVEVLGNSPQSDHFSHYQVRPSDAISVRQFFSDVVNRVPVNSLTDPDGIQDFEDLKSRTQVHCSLL